MKKIDRLSELFTNILERPSLYKLVNEDKKLIQDSCSLFLDNILKEQPEYYDEFIDKAIKKLDWIENTLFLNVTPSKPVPVDFHEKYYQHWKKTQHDKSTHLELGTWITWPDIKVNDYIKNEGIGDFIRLDMDYSFKPDLAASATAIPLEKNCIDRISSNSLFEHVAYPHEILKEVYRILKPGGVFYTAVPFHFVQHDCPKDYLRYTGAFFEDVCKDLGFSEVYVDTKSSSGVYYTIHNLAKAAIVEATLADREKKIAQQFHSSVLILLAILQAIDDDFLAYGASHWHTTHIVAVKNGVYEKRITPLDRAIPFVERWKEYFISPDNGDKLILNGDKLKTEDNIVEYPVIDGIPVLLPKINSSNSIFKAESKAENDL